MHATGTDWKFSIYLDFEINSRMNIIYDDKNSILFHSNVHS